MKFAGLKELLHFDVTDTNVTEQGVTALKAALPKCQVQSGKRGPDGGK